MCLPCHFLFWFAILQENMTHENKPPLADNYKISKSS